MPLMGFAYFLQFLDKLALSQATLFNLREDLVSPHRTFILLKSDPLQNLQGSNYSWTSAVFYFGYFFWSWPSSYVIVRLPIGKYLACSV